MSEERDVVVIGTNSVPVITEEVRKAQTKKQQTDEEYEAQVIRVLERGVIMDRLTVEDLPPDLHAEWCRNDPFEIDRKRGLGFEIETRFGHRGLHSEGDGRAIIGDVVLMSIPMHRFGIIQKARQKLFDKRHGDPRKPKDRRIEESSFAEQAQQVDLPIMEGGSTTLVERDLSK